MTPAFRSWLLAAAVGKTYIYHTGNLTEDRHRYPAAEWIDKLAADVWRASEAGLVILSQRRLYGMDGHALSGFDYIATRTAEMAA
jgi:hypothetical protein